MLSAQNIKDSKLTKNMTILLAGDIGGTKTILCLVSSELKEGAKLPNREILHQATFASQEFTDLVPMVRHFLTNAHGKLGEKLHPAKACFGIAGPVVKNRSNLTNLSWSLGGDRLQKELNISQVDLINDFAAIGYGVLGLNPTDLHILQAGEVDTQAPICVIGAGTGLGECFLTPSGNSYRVFSTEGGHTDFPARSKLEFQLREYIREKYNLSRVSVERVISGSGIVAIYQFLRDKDPSEESPEMAKTYASWSGEIGKSEKTIDLAAIISATAMTGNDYLCEQTMKIFIEAYGAEAGNVAVKFLPYGGFYIAGGIAAKILPLIEEHNFLKSFLEKGRVSLLLEHIPVYIVKNPEVGLIGAALYAGRA